MDKIKENYGFAFCRDNKRWTIDDVLKYGIVRFYEKYPNEKIDFIECSIKEASENFMYENINVVPRKIWMPGNIWIKPVDLEK